MALPLTQTHGSIQAFRRQMGTDQRQTAEEHAELQRWQASGNQPPLFRGDPVDATHWSAVAGTPERVRLGFDLLAPASGMGKERDTSQTLAGISLGTLRSAENQMGRVLCGWELRFRQKRGSAVGKTKRGKGTKWMVLVDGTGLPLGVSLESATPAEVTLAPHLKKEVRGKPERLIGDRAYDSNAFRAHCAALGIDPIIPKRSNNHRATHQDGRKLRRYRHRWIIERTFAWLGSCRRLVVRWERSLEMYRGFFHLALIMLTLRRVLK